jgi:hypothetical protein
MKMDWMTTTILALVSVTLGAGVGVLINWSVARVVRFLFDIDEKTGKIRRPHYNTPMRRGALFPGRQWPLTSAAGLDVKSEFFGVTAEIRDGRLMW